jgi:hypothetical protein
MSCFCGSFNSKPELVNQFNTIFSDFTCSVNTLKLGTTPCNFVIYPQSKAIEDILITDEASDSWMMLVGVPFINEKMQNKRQKLLERFLNDPVETLRCDIDGHFALIAFDAAKLRLILATDINNFIPIFWSKVSGGVVFSSSELAIAKLLKPNPDPLGFAQAIYLGVTLGPLTRFDNIFKLGPCELMIFNGYGSTTREKYWRPVEEDLWKGDFDTVLGRWMEMLGDSVRMFCKNSTNNRVSSDFTAGEDARLIVAQCHALGIPFQAQVGGFPDDSDVIVAGKAAKKANFDLNIRPRCMVSDDQVIQNARRICLSTDGYGSFFSSCCRFATDENEPPLEYQQVHFCGLNGGAAFRGSYYMRAKVLFPSMAGDFDYKFFTRLKFLLDFVPGLLKISDKEFLGEIYRIVEKELTEVEKFPAGIKVDHLLRALQTTTFGLSMKRPFYLPLALRDMTRSIYMIPPHIKRWGRMTKACTEILFPELAFTKTQNGVPTVRISMTRLPLFLPAFLATLRKVARGTISRLLKLQHTTKSLDFHHRLDLHMPTLRVLSSHSPYSNWFSHSGSMVTGEFYNSDDLNLLLSNARKGKCKHIHVLGRIINQEIAFRFVFED